jgi:hypothetical protein|tara:strand:+ start:793 stop:993 length:201 start_codon:yes stop_codon:yes gene_type:complete
MVTVERKEPVWDCKAMQEHYEIVSACCGAGEHEHVEAMCGACNEFSSWFCSVCEEDVDDAIWHTSL